MASAAIKLDSRTAAGAASSLRLSPYLPEEKTSFVWIDPFEGPTQVPWPVGVFVQVPKSSAVWIVANLVSFFDWSDAPIRNAKIEQSDLPDGERYIVKSPIPITVYREDDGTGFTATFRDAQISIGGESFHDAFHALVVEILDAFDYLSAHQNELGAEPQRQLEILGKYLGKVNN